MSERSIYKYRWRWTIRQNIGFLKPESAELMVRLGIKHGKDIRKGKQQNGLVEVLTGSNAQDLSREWRIHGRYQRRFGR